LAALGLFALVFAMAGCGADESSPVTGPPGSGPPTCEAGQMLLDDGRCQPAGLPLDMQCNAGELPLEGGGCQPAGLPLDMPCPPGEAAIAGGGCQPAGVPPDACAEGFEADGQGGCDPVLPAAPCPPGLMAIPGDTQCREVAPCGSGDYGSVPVDATTQFVNKTYAGGDSNGTMIKPWTSIQAGINNAASGAIVAVAAGTYNEDLTINGKSIRLWGRCPALVSVAGVGVKTATLSIILQKASQSEVHSLAITGPGVGILISGASDVLVDQAWIHDTMNRGINIANPSSVTVRSSLIESAKDVGVWVGGSGASIESSVVRDTQPRNDGTAGEGISLVYDQQAQERSTLSLRTSVLENNREIGVFIIGSDAEIEATVIRATQPNGAGNFGFGIISFNLMGERPKFTLRSSVLEMNHGAGACAFGGDATLEATVVRATQPMVNGTQGYGLQISPGSKGERSALSLRSSIVEQNSEGGVLVEGSDATIESTIVRDTQLDGAGALGHGVEIAAGSKVTLLASVVEKNHEAGVFVEGSEATIEASVVRDNKPNADGLLGRGIAAQMDLDTLERATLMLRSSLVEKNHDTGVLAAGAEVSIEESIIRETQPQSDGTWGVGVQIQGNLMTPERSALTLRASLVEQNHGMGVGLIDADATIEFSVVRGTQPNGNGMHGRGIEVATDLDPLIRSTLALRSSLVEQNHDVGLVIHGSVATIEASIVRDTKPAPPAIEGMGIVIQRSEDSLERSTAELRYVIVEKNHGTALLIVASDATIDATVVRATQAAGDGTDGRGIGVEESSTLTLRAALIEENREVGVFIMDSDATIEDTVVRATQTEVGGLGGDGINVASADAPATVMITSTRIEENARAGIANIGATVVLVSSTVQCNGFNLDGEDLGAGKTFTYDGSKDNLCGCGDDPDPTCPVVSENLSAPDPISPVKPSK
jgi:hypothetical protein